MQPITQMQQKPTLQGFEDGVLKVHAFFDLHPWVPIVMLVAIVVLGIVRRWNMRKKG